MTKTIKECYEAAVREVSMRMRVYPRWVANGKMTQTTAHHELECMQTIAASLKKQLEDLQGSLV